MKTIFEKSNGVEGIGFGECKLGDYLPQVLLRKEAVGLPQLSELEVMRHYKELSDRNFCIEKGFYPLGSCTMKYNPKVNELLASLEGFVNLHPLQDDEDAQGALELMYNLQEELKKITGMDAVTLQPAAGAHGELTGMMVIKKYFEVKGETKRKKVIVPDSAHGTNPASAKMCGFDIVEVKSNSKGQVDVESLKSLLDDEVAAIMMTNPNTLGIFEENVLEISKLMHDNGSLLYYDGANFNAIMGWTNPALMGFDVVHLNLHKTFASPHGGGGPGVGPICVAEHLVPFLPGHGIFGNSQNQVSAAPFGSAGILPITYGYIRMMGAEGLTQATKIAILNANYLATCLKDTYGVVYRGANGFVGHEMILECRKVHEEAGISENDIAKRLMDYGYHAPTLSFPVHGTLMIEPTESESLAELDNFVDVMLNIWKEIQEVKNGEADKDDNVLINAPHPEYEIVSDRWEHSYTREKAAYPIESVRDNKFWVNVARVDNTLGDRKLLPTRYGTFE